MSECPECQTNLKEDFGITTCPSCGTVCFIDLEGNVQVQEERTHPVEEEADFRIEVDLEPDSEQEESDQLEESFDQDQLPITQDVVDDTEEMGESLEAEPFDDEELEGSDELTQNETSFETLDEEPEEGISVIDSESMSVGSFFEDLEVFSQNSTADEFDHVYYDLVIKGVEGLKEQTYLIEILGDSRLGFSEDFIKSSFEGPVLTLNQISFLKLVVLHKRIVDFNFDITWILSENQDDPVDIAEDLETDET